MSYNIQHLSTAGRATIFTVLLAVACFAAVFFLNVGSQEFKQAVAQSDTASTSVTVVNLPPVITYDAREALESSTSSPTNSGDQVVWEAIAVDGAGEDYWLLICDTNATPTPAGGSEPTCASGVQWAVSDLTSSGATATAATTTVDRNGAANLFNESNDWYAFVCDDNTDTQRCSGTNPAQQGVGTGTSPFYVNSRPLFTAFSNDGPVDPDGTLTFYSTSTDDDVVPGGFEDTVRIIVCATAGFDTVTDECDGGNLDTLASSTVFVSDDASAQWTLTPPWMDTTYNAYPYVIDNHGHEAVGALQGSTTQYVINNVAPTIDESTVSLNGGLDMVLTQEAGETTGFTLDFTYVDNNSCTTTLNTPEVVGYEVSVYRDDGLNNYPADGNTGSTTCRVDQAGDYDPNDCYTTAVATTTWNFSCTASSTACGGDTDTTGAFECTFPLWFVADPTDATTTAVQYPLNDWKAQIRAIDDDNATGTLGEADSGVEVNSFLAFALNTILIPYGSLAPGEDTDDNWPGGLGVGGNQASTTIQATGNVGLDERVSGDAMCTTYSGPASCPNSTTSTIADFNQVFTPTSTVDYATASSSGNQLSSTTDQEVEVNNPKSTSTSSPATSTTYWGILIPDTISLSGDYTGQNTIIAIVGESADW